MKKLLIILYIFLNAGKGYCQDDLLVKSQIDSILQKIAVEKNTDKRVSLILNIFLTRVEAYPHLALYTYEKLYQLGQADNDDITKAMALSFAGHGYRMSGNYIKGLEYHHKAIALAEITGNPTVIALAQILMAHLYKDRQEYKIALQLYLEANKISPDAPDAAQIIHWCRINLSSVYLATNQLDSCIYYAKKTASEKDSSPYYSSSLVNVAGAYSKMGKIKEAENYYRRAIAYTEEEKRPRLVQLTYLGFAEHFRRINQTDSCIYYAKKALAVLNNTEFGFLSLAPAKLLMNVYQESNADSTLKYLKIYTAANDSVFSNRANEQLQMMTFEEDLRQRNAASEKIAYQNKIKSNVLFGGLALFSLIAIILYRNNLQKQKANTVLKQTLGDLKATQAQLIQSEKMASLGELTAGIAHEIQNPLNFVNNFSEVNSELVDEIENENSIDEIKTIAADIKLNSEKILFHGRRADAIVKGMLQHSRQTKGIKEPTDINALCDEYLRLSYHGLRAKDKGFNADFKTNFDETIEKIKIVPQDIGRVLLNLFNNAFYAVNEKQKTSDEKYKPLVSVQTKKVNDKIEITVSDNGSGIPQNITDKIFHPFFTTKPTGQGTGLGLSLAYDIITKEHNGTIKVESKEGEGSMFIIQLLS